MKQPYRNPKITRWSMAAGALRLLANSLKAWPLLLLLALLLAERTPHLLWTYQRTELGSHYTDRNCLYLGIRGKVRAQPGRTCPLIAMIDPSNPNAGDTQ